MLSLADLTAGLPLDPLPSTSTARRSNVPHAPARKLVLSRDENKIAIQNALRYFPPSTHEVLADEFSNELRNYGHIYMYRFRPNIIMKAYPVQEYPAKCRQAAAVMHMIMNNLDDRVAQFPDELVTYGGNGQVFSNWAQFWIVMHYLSTMSDTQTLVLYSGHPLGLFPSHRDAPRVIITNGMVIPNYSSREMYEKLFALGVTMYGQMTAGSYCYIGPQGIVHGTTITVMNAGRKLGFSDLAGKVFVTSGLGGMSGAQAKAAVICGCIGVIAEVSEDAVKKRQGQGWVMESTSDLSDVIARIRRARAESRAVSIAYHGNVVDLWERLVEETEKTGDRLVDLGSDQTSCHNPFLGGYYPAGVTYSEAQDIMHKDPERFKNLVQDSLRRQVTAINKLSDAGMFFWDYGNAFLLEAMRAGADVGLKNSGGVSQFRYPSYVQHIMGDIFSMGFGPFRWVCTSGDPADLEVTDKIAADVIESLIEAESLKPVREQYVDNLQWIQQAASHNLVVGSQARILYSNERGRVSIALAFNKAVANKSLKGPVVISRDHHDVSGTDSPFRETSNIYDGSAYCADMAVQNAIGDSFRGATWVALHNGGGVGWGEVINGGFGLVLDGSEDAARRAELMLSWDVLNGVARRSWSGNALAEETVKSAMEANTGLQLTMPYHVQDEDILSKALSLLDSGSY